MKNWEAATVRSSVFYNKRRWLTIGIWAGISHTESVGLVVLEIGELIFKVSSPDALPTRAVP